MRAESGTAVANPAGEVTLLLAELKLGHNDALAKLIPLLYGELHHVAARYLDRERAGHTLQPTALLNEAFLRLMRQNRADWQDRGHFVAVAAQLMRRVLVDYARRRATGKRAGCAVWLEEEVLNPGWSEDRTEEILAVEEILERLARLDSQQARIVELRYFGGLSIHEVAAALNISTSTVTRDWAVAKAWLRAALADRRSP